jgi:hypothetical protein
MSCLKIINKFKKSRKMKTKVIITSVIVLFLLAIFTMVGCREDPPTLSVEIKPTQVVYNGSATLTWQGENLTSLRINGIDQSKLNFGSMSLDNLQESMTYDFVAIGLDGTTISRSVSIQVGEPIPELKVTVTPNTVVPYKGSATVGWEGKNLASLTVNGVNSSELKYGSIPLSNLVEDTTFNFVATGLDGSTLNQSALVDVAEPTRTDTLCGNYWGKVEWKYWYEGRYLYVILTDEIRARRLVFTKDGRFNIFDGNGKLIGNGNWSWKSQDSFDLAGTIYKYKLSDTNFIISEKNDSTVLTYKAYPL